MTVRRQVNKWIPGWLQHGYSPISQKLSEGYLSEWRVHSYIQTLVLRDSTGRVPVAGEREYVHVPVAGLPSQDVFRIVHFGGLPFRVPPRYRT